VTAGYSIAEVIVSSVIIGKSLSEIKIRSNYGLEVLMIKHPHEMFEENQEKELVKC